MVPTRRKSDFPIIEVDSMAASQPFPILKTERLVLRQLTADDSDRWFLNLSNDEVAGLIGMDPLSTVEESERIINSFSNRFEKGTGIAWAISLKAHSSVHAVMRKSTKKTSVV